MFEHKGSESARHQGKRFEIGWCEDQANMAFIRKHTHLLSAEEALRFLGEVGYR